VTHSGCLVLAAAGAAGAGVAYTKGDTETIVAGTPQDVAVAAEQAASELDLAVISNQTGPTESTVVARNARDVKVEVTARAHSDRHCALSIRAGVFGDDALQGRMLAKIQDHLAANAAPAVQTTDN
jgi:hypothetical protein